MKQKCFEPGVIQAFTDGELDCEASEKVLKHVSACEACSALLSECEEESSFAFSLLDDELNVLVPTERLRAKVFDRIGEIESERRTSWFAGFASGLAGLFNFGSPGLSVAAAVLVVFGMLAIGFGVLRNYDAGNQLANVPEPVRSVAPASGSESVAEIAPARSADTAEVSEDTQRNDEVAEQRRPVVRTAVYRAPDRTKAVQETDPVVDAVLPEPSVVSEDSFIQTIATLDRTVTNSKETLSASERIAFERDLAVVDNAIVKMREEVRRNPENQAAREVLKSSYQSKVDLLNSVAEKTELMASLQ